MNFVFDLIPVIVFFLSYQLYGIFAATVAAIIASIVQVIVPYVVHKTWNKMHLISCILITILGSATLLLKDEMYIKWKPTAIYALLSVVFFTSIYWGDKPLVQRLIGDKIELPSAVWQKLNTSWALFFLAVSLTNLYIIYHFDTQVWIYFKLFGTLALAMIFLLLQGIYLSFNIYKKNGS